MKTFKIIAVLCAFVLVITSLCSCGYEISIRKKGEGDERTTTIMLDDLSAPAGDEPIYIPDAATLPAEENTTTSGGANIQVDTSYQPMAMSASDVIQFYKSAMDDVKVRAPGYVRNEYQEVSDVEAGNGDVQLMNRILNLVGTELLKDSGDEEATIQIMAHDDIAVRETFPLYNKDVGCELTDMSIVKSAVCYSNGSTYKIVITFDDILNPDAKDSAFADIMTPIDRDALSDPIEEYLVVLDLNSYKFDMNYTNCEITCIIDKQTNRMTSLKHKMIMDIEIVMNLDLILFQTNNIKAEGKIVNFLEYYNFDWT
ncbi:MAG: hypothetical protein IKL10_03585 [Clostridia bacterium]|nr:hypothetical protein [Clostridia bacterium]